MFQTGSDSDAGKGSPIKAASFSIKLLVPRTNWRSANASFTVSLHMRHRRLDGGLLGPAGIRGAY
jgi:hypothetical protein